MLGAPLLRCLRVGYQNLKTSAVGQLGAMQAWVAAHLVVASQAVGAMPLVAVQNHEMVMHHAMAMRLVLDPLLVLLA